MSGKNKLIAIVTSSKKKLNHADFLWSSREVTSEIFPDLSDRSVVLIQRLNPHFLLIDVDLLDKKNNTNKLTDELLSYPIFTFSEEKFIKKSDIDPDYHFCTKILNEEFFFDITESILKIKQNCYNLQKKLIAQQQLISNCESHYDLIFHFENTGNYPIIDISTNNSNYSSIKNKINQNYFDLIPDNQKKLVFEKIHSAINEKTVITEFEHEIFGNFKDSIKVTSVLNLTKVFFDDSNIITSYLKIKTPENDIKTVNEKERKFFKLIIDSLPYPFYVIDVENYNVLFSNKAANPVKNKDKSLCYKVIKNKDIPCSSDQSYECPLVSIKDNKKIVVNHIDKLSNGAVRVFENHCFPVYNEDGIVDKMIEYQIDTTDSYKNKEKLDKLSQAVNHSPAMIVITDQKGKIEFVNPKFTRVTGYTSDEVSGRDLSVLKSGLQSSKFYEEFWNIISSGKDWRGEFGNKKKNGDFFWESASVSSIKGDNGKIKNYLKISEDITEQRKIQQELVLAKEEAINANNAKSNFISNISHELRTPMNGIMGLTDLLLESSVNIKDQDYLSLIKKSANNLLLLINDLLDFSKIQSGKFSLENEEFNFIDTIKETLKSLYHRAVRQNIRILYDIDPKIPQFLIGDPQRLNQILNNLLSNSIKFTKSGYIFLKIWMKEINKDIINIMFSVEDSGIGIPNENIESIFASFVQVDSSKTRKYEGTGLGLSITKQLVELMKGNISVESHVNQGSTFSFDINLRIPFKPIFQVENYSDVIKKMNEYFVVFFSHNEKFASFFKKILDKFNLKNLVISQVSELKNIIQPYSKKMKTIYFLYDLVENDFIYLNDILKENDVIVSDNDIYKTTDSLKKVTFFNIELVDESDLISFFRTIGGIKPKENVSNKVLKKDIKFSGLKILIAEDDDDNQKLIKNILQNQGFKVELATNGREVIEKFASNSFDLILMDVQMPVMNGLDATKEIRRIESKNLNHIPIIAMTAYAMKEDEQLCLKAGMDYYISKPLNLEQLLIIIKDIDQKTFYGVNQMKSLNQSSAEIFNKKAFLDTCMGDKDLALNVSDTFLTKIDSELSDLKKAVEKKDFKQINAISHKIKGSLGSFSAIRAMNVARNLENSAKSENEIEVEKFYPLFLEELEIFRSILIEFKKELI